MTRTPRVLPLVAFATVLLAILVALPAARAPDVALLGPPTAVAFDSNGDGRADSVHVSQVVHAPQGNTTATLEGHLFRPSANPNVSWSGWVGASSVTRAITCASASGCDQTFNLDLHAPAGGTAGNYIVVLNVTQASSVMQTIVTGSVVAGTFPTSIAADDGGFLEYREGIDPVEAEIAYRSNTGSNGVSAPKNRTLDGSSWTTAADQATAGSPIRAVRMAWSPATADERMVITQSDDGRLDAYVCTTTCNVTNNIGQVWSTAPATPEQRFDIAYESLSGDALLVYGVLSTNTTRDIAYRTYAGGTWSAEQYLDDAGHATDVQFTLINLASKKASDLIGLVAGDNNNDDVNAWIWDGTTFGSDTEITASARSPNEQEAAIAWESGSGDLLVVAAQSGNTNILSKEFTTNWSAASTFRCVSTASGLWLSLKSNPMPAADDMVLAVGDSGSDLSTCYWNGGAWENWTVQDTALDFINARSFDFAWEGAGSAGLLVYGTTAGQITRRPFTPPGTWGPATNATMGTNTHKWVQLRTNPDPGAGGARILGAVLENGANDLGAVSWDGTSFTVGGAGTFTDDTGTATYESFDLKPGAAGKDRLFVRYDWTTVSAANFHTLVVKGYRGDEDVLVQVLTPPSSWTARLTIAATTSSNYSYTLTTAEYNGGSPSIRFIDRGGPGSTVSGLWIDWVVIRPASAPAGTTSSATVLLDPGLAVNLFGFEFGLNPLTLFLAVAIAAVAIAFVVWRSRRRHAPARRKAKGAPRGRRGARRPSSTEGESDTEEFAPEEPEPGDR